MSVVPPLAVPMMAIAGTAAGSIGLNWELSITLLVPMLFIRVVLKVVEVDDTIFCIDVGPTEFCCAPS